MIENISSRKDEIIPNNSSIELHVGQRYMHCINAILLLLISSTEQKGENILLKTKKLPWFIPFFASL